jgi:cephalosporin-C deacetylase-like acetyl esterase
MFEGFREEMISGAGADIFVRHGGKVDGPGLLLLHGYPQTSAMWHKVAPQLADQYHVVCADLRGYGRSSKPKTDAQHSPYSKRAMAADMVKVMAHLGHDHAGLLSYRADDRLPLVEMKTLTGFTNLEEAAVGLTEVVHFLLQSKLEEGGASFSDGGVFSEHIVVDGLLVTGQNPVFSHKAAKSLLALLGKE